MLFILVQLRDDGLSNTEMWTGTFFKRGNWQEYIRCYQYLSKEISLSKKIRANTWLNLWKARNCSVYELTKRRCIIYVADPIDAYNEQKSNVPAITASYITGHPFPTVYIEGIMYTRTCSRYHNNPVFFIAGEPHQWRK